jgi:hypothetical protein
LNFAEALEKHSVMPDNERTAAEILCGLDDFLSEDGGPVLDGIPVEVLDFLVAALEAAQSLLRLLPPDLTPRQYLERLLRQLPAEPLPSIDYAQTILGLDGPDHDGEDPIAQAGGPEPLQRKADRLLRENRMRALRGFLTIPPSEILDMPCFDAGGRLFWGASKVRELMQKPRGKVPPAPPTPKHGPARAPRLRYGPFRFGRRTYSIPYNQSLLLECLQELMPEFEDGLVPEGVVSEYLETTKGTLRKLQYDTNNTLLKQKIPLAVSRPACGYLALEKVRYL